jgi:tetratricopeptide (TPR) repeat protein
MLFASLILAFSLTAQQDDIGSVEELYREGRFPEAQAKLVTIAPTKENVVELLLYKGLLENDAEKSIASLRKILNDYPQSKYQCQVLYTIALHEFLKESYKKAISCLEEITRSKERSEYYDISCLWIARCHDALHDTTKALHWYGKVEEGDSASYAVAQEALKALAKENSIYSIQIGSFQNRESAQNLAASYAEKGYETWLATTQKDGVKYYKVLIGEFDSKDMAKGFLELFTEKENATFWIIKIKRL